MNTSTPTTRHEWPFELRFRSLFIEGRGYAFPCDPQGKVVLDSMSEPARCNYLYARAMVGREFDLPVVTSH
ncbi:hypothetical protein J2X20_002891 [Pelomonas saccharophila]|uniref:Uncharacterized protein n=1 Tax=Roseateles saccharophilus TaxID=304 RepID=A0ABU1YMZ1_ROSSA|nr:hypothetical protein [Roseateles saccharophilus]MDR7270233.1 hypothetical protein [Roseateles saccharophilus]